MVIIDDQKVCWSVHFLADDVEELFARGEVVEECPGEIRSRGDGVLLLDATHLHAHMLTLNDYGYAERVESLLDALFDLRGETLLHLETASESIDDTRELAEPSDVVAWDVADMSLAEEREHVMFAHRIHFDVLDDNHLLILLLEHGAAEDCLGILIIALEKELHRLGDTLGSLDKPLT